jgi:vacuolar-type H+-ATPase subunit F/Vma7
VKANTVALVARADQSRTQIAKYLRDGGYEVFECEDLTIASQFVGVVIIDAEAAEPTRARVQAWLRGAESPRVVVISSKPTGWKALSMAHSDDIYVLAAPAFGWEVVDALRATPPTSPPA